MPLLRDRVRETTTTVGTGTITLGGAVTGYQSFNTAFTNGETTYYVIQGGTEWEIGIGTIGAGTLARTTVLQSSNADALVPFSAGTKDVFCSYVADRAVTTSDAATLTNKTLDDYTNNIGANSTHFRIKATGTISKGQVVKATGFTPGESAIEVAVVTSATDLALGIAEQALTAGQFGLAVVIGELFDVNTNGLSVGAIIYSNGTGGYTTTKPSSGTYQPLGWVVRANLNNGVIAVNIVAPLYVETSTNTANTAVLRDGSGNFAAGTITATLNGAAPAGSLTGTTLASNVVSSSLTSVGTLSSLTVSGNLTVDTNTLFVDAANNSVGIGTVTPVAPGGTSATLNVANSTQAAFAMSATTDAADQKNWFWQTGSAIGAGTYRLRAINDALTSGENAYVVTRSGTSIQTHQWSTAATERVRIDASGNVGIGTASPDARLQVTVSDAETSQFNQGASLLHLTNTNQTNNNWAQLWFTDADGSATSATFGAQFTDHINNYAALSFATRGTTGLAERVRITESGNVGIGTASPIAQLANTNGTDGISSANSTGLAWRSTANEWAGVIISRPASGLSYGLRVHSGGTSATDYPLWVSSGAGSGSTLFGVTGAGNVGIGTATPAGRLHVISSGVNSIFDSGAAADGRIELRYNGVRQGLIGFDSGIVNIRADLSSVLRLGAGNADRWSISTAGHFLAITDASFDIGASGANRPRDLYLSGNALVSGNLRFLGTAAGIVDGAGNATLTITQNGSLQLTSAGTWTNGNIVYNAAAASGLHAWLTNSVERMRIDASGNLLVGKTAASVGTNGAQFLTTGFSGVSASNTTAFFLNRNGSDGTVMEFGRESDSRVTFGVTSQSLTIGTGGSERMRLDASGNLGLGVAPSAWGSTIKAFEQPAGAVASLSTTQQYIMQNLAFIGGSWLYKDSAAGSFYRQQAGAHAWITAPSGTAGAVASLTTAMTLDASGNLGLGVTPSAWGSTYRSVQTRTTGFYDEFGTLGGVAFNAFYNGTNWIYNGAGGNATAQRYEQGSPGHRWFSAVTGAGGATITWGNPTMHLDASGNLGLGVTPSAWSTGKAVEVGQNGTALWSVSAVDAYLTQGAYFNSSFRYSHTGAGGVSAYQQASGTHKWYIAAGGTAGNAITFTQAMTLDANGNLGIGTTSPAQRFVVAQNANAATTATVVNADSGTSASARLLLDTTAGPAYIENRRTGVGLYFNVNSVDRWQINSSGHLLAGADASYDIGASGANRPRNVFVATSVTLADSATISSPDNFSIRDTSSSIARFSFSTSNVYNTRTAGTHQFQTAGTERVRVKAEGQVRFVPLAAAPTTNVEDGDVYYDSSTNKLRVRAGGAWVDLH